MEKAFVRKDLFENGAAAFQSQERPHRPNGGEAETDRVLGEEDAEQGRGPG
jgi:hypothetical protein